MNIATYWMACCLAATLFPTWLCAVQLNSQQILKLSLQATQADWKAAPRYAYTECDEDIKGGTKTTKTYQVLMLGGTPYSRLIAVNGKPLSLAQDAAEEQKLQKEKARRAQESPQLRAQRISRYKKDRAGMFALLRQMTDAMDFKLQGEQNLGGRDVYVFAALPRPDYRPPNRETRLLTGMKGKLWIDKGSNRWVKVEADAIKPVWMGWFIAQVLPGTRFELEQAPVGSGIWLPVHFSVDAHARILGFSKDYFHAETYSDYLPAASELMVKHEGNR